MPRTVTDILEHADELAKRFEDYEPSSDDSREPEVFAALRRSVLARSEAERSIGQAGVCLAAEQRCAVSVSGRSNRALLVGG